MEGAYFFGLNGKFIKIFHSKKIMKQIKMNVFCGNSGINKLLKMYKSN